MAQIYLAKAFGAEGFVKPLVIKRLDPQLATKPYFTNLFIHEAKLLVTLNHGNIVPVFDFGRVGEDLYIAMEYIAGASLRQMLAGAMETGRRLDHTTVAYIGAEICKGLAYAHHKTDERGRPAGIVHRDIKPTNVLVSVEGEVKIVDFGVAKLAGRVEGSGQLTGTVAYMSPEQAERLVVDHRTDIFSTGLVLHELLTARRAYDVQTPREALAHARRAQLRPLPPEVPGPLREIVERATRREPEARFASAHEMELALSDLLVRWRTTTDGTRGVPPSVRLATLIKGLALEWSIAEPSPSPSPDDYSTEEGEPAEVSGLLELDAPDLAVIRGAAETFHSELLTRILSEEEEAEEEEEPAPAPAPASPPAPAPAPAEVTAAAPGRRRRWLVGLGGGAICAAAGLSTWWVLAGNPLVRSGGPPVDLQPRRVVRPSADGARPISDAGRNGPRDAGTPDVAAEPVADAGRSGRRARHGYLNLNSIPWSQVTIDGRTLSRPTPLLKIKLRAGAHTLILVNTEKKLHKRVQVTIRAGATTWKLVHLR